MIALLYAFLSFIFYLTPIYVIYLDNTARKIILKKYDTIKLFERMFTPFKVYLYSALLGSTVILLNIWGNDLLSPFLYFYLFLSFNTILNVRNKNSNWKSFMISTFLIFIIAELWELPIILNNLLIQNPERNFKMLSITFLKLLSIPFLIIQFKTQSIEKLKCKWINIEHYILFWILTLINFGLIFWLSWFWKTAFITETLYIGIIVKVSLGVNFMILALSLRSERKWIYSV